MGIKKKKWYQTGEFEDGYQVGDVFRTVKNSISGKEKDVEKVKNVTQKSGTRGATAFGAVENGKLTIDPSVQLYGFANEKERQDYIRENPELYTAMGGYKYVPSGTPLRNTESITNSNKAIEKIVERFKNTDVNKVQNAINEVSSGQWLDKKTIKKHKSTINSYVNDYISLNKLGYFDSLSKEERKNNVEILQSIKKDVENKNTLYTTFGSIYDYNAYIMNNTAEQENGMSVESIAMRAKAYNENSARLDVIDNEITNMTNEEKWVKVLNPYNGSQMANTTINKPTKAYQNLLDQKAYLEEQNRIYERFNRENDSLLLRFANSSNFEVNSKYIPQKSDNTKYGAFNPDDYRTFLEYYNIGADALVHSERVRNGEEVDDYWYTGQSRGWDYATSDEFKMLNYLANTQGDVAAQSYYEKLSRELLKRRYMAQEEKWDENYKNAEWYEKIGLNVLSVPEKLYGTALDAVEGLGNLVTGQEYDPYASYRTLTNHATNTRKNTAIEIDEATGGAEFLGVSWGDAYQAAMSGIDSIAGVATFGGKIYPVIAGIGASSAKAKQLYEQGASDSQIAVASIFAGVAEMAFEKISIGYFLDEFVNAPAKKWYQLLLKSVAQGGIEMTEEMATELSNIITDTMVLGSRSDWGKLISSYKEQGYSDSDAIISAMWDMGGNILETGICGLISGGTMSSAGSTVNHLSNNTQSNKKTYIGFEEFSNNRSNVWNNVEYFDEITKLDIMQKTHNAMVQDGAVVKVPQETIENVAEAYPDLRGVKKKERTPILKESMSNLKENIRQFLNGFKNQKFEFDVKGKILEARLYSTGINEVLEKITQEKANMLYSTEDIFKNSRYMYSTTDYDGNPNIYRWNYFYTPVQIGDDVVGVRIAIRDIAEGQEHGPESQIYNWNIKKDISLDGAQPVKNDSSRDVSSDISIYNISKTQEKVNNDYIEKEASSQEDNASFFDGYELYENNPTTADAVPLPLGKGDVKLNPDEVIEGIWEDSPKKDKNIVEKSQLESVENIQENGIMEKKSSSVPGEYTTTISWSIFKKLLARPEGKGYFTKKIKQHNPRVEAYENKINPNKEGYHIKHPDGRYIQFENMRDGILQDGKLVMSKRSFYFVYDKGDFAKRRVLNQAIRQMEVADSAGYKVEWLISSEKAVEQISRLFMENNIDIIVKFYPE